MRTHEFTCIVCPLSCHIELAEEHGEILEIRGHICKQGEKYATEEFRNPVRMLTTTISIEGGILPVLPVRSREPLPKHLMKQCVRELSAMKTSAPIKCGDIICENILNTGVTIIASRDMPRKN